MGRKSNLHQIWDSKIIYQRLDRDFDGSEEKYGDWLLDQIKGDWSDKADEWRQCKSKADYQACTSDWASESIEASCTHAYVDANGDHIDDGFDLGEDYYKNNIDVVDIQLAKGGVRLANVLNNMFSS
eukprot:GFYU01001819.1.p1 GENE.GFYU01001819.1~~GFYU01001819.1.p1  ORF type:complete len:127 (-),score=49.31 GFYU01001819.1:36-416(-)